MTAIVTQWYYIWACRFTAITLMERNLTNDDQEFHQYINKVNNYMYMYMYLSFQIIELNFKEDHTYTDVNPDPVLKF